MKDKINQILKNTLLFLLIFIAVQYVFQFFQDDEQLPTADGNVIFTTTDTEYSRPQTVTVNLENNTTESLIIPNECPKEPFNVYRYENNEWVQKSSEPELNCENAEDITLASGQKIKIDYDNWNHALFSEMGRFRIEFPTTIKGEEKTLTTNEFVIVEEGIFRKLFTGVFYRPIYNALIYLTAIIPGHILGLAIILLTIIIRTILLAPSHKAMRSQRKMQEIQPRLEKIKEKYKGDQQRIAMETMAIWKESKINPMSGCLPILLQFPFLIAVFYVIQDGLNPDKAYLLYQQYSNFSLHDINIMFLGLDLTRVNIYVLPLIIGGLQFIQMKLTMARQKKNPKKGKKDMASEMQMATNMMVYIMPIMIAVFTASLPAGVGIYWGTSTIYGIFQQLVVNKSMGKGDDKNSDDVKVRVIEKK